MTTHDDRMRLRQLLAGFQATQAIHVAVSIGLADLLASDTKSSDELARSSRSDPRALRRLILALVAIGVFRRTSDDRFALTPMGQLLRRDAPGSQAHRAEMMGRPFFWRAWGDLSHSVATGETAFEHVHGVDGWAWRNAHPEDGTLFDAAMAADAAWMGDCVMEAYDFSRFRHIVDVGGGDGSLLASILASLPSLRGTVFEQPRVVAEAQQTAAHENLGERYKFVAGSFFDGVPTGGDAYLLKWIMHNWSDEDCVRILRNCRKAMGMEAHLLIIEQIVNPVSPDIAGTLMDLNMMVMNGGRERTEAELVSLLRVSGFKPVKVTNSTAGLSVLEAQPG